MQRASWKIGSTIIININQYCFYYYHDCCCYCYCYYSCSRCRWCTLITRRWQINRHFLFIWWLDQAKLQHNQCHTHVQQQYTDWQHFPEPRNCYESYQRGDLYVPLTNDSTVTSLPDSSIRIDPSNADYISLSTAMLSSTFIYSPLVISYANSTRIHPTTYCMYVFNCFYSSCVLITWFIIVDRTWSKQLRCRVPCPNYEHCEPRAMPIVVYFARFHRWAIH